MGKIIDLTGQKIGRLTVLQRTSRKSTSGEYYWLCKCDCGNEKEVLGGCLRRGTTKSCGCLQKEKARNLIYKQHEKNKEKYSLVGQRFGKLVVLEDSGKRTEQRRIIYKCQCDCGNICEKSSAVLVSGDSISCGCLRQSKGEYIIEQFLKQNNINYKTEYAIKEIRTEAGGIPRFDFAIFSEDNQIQCFIEFDGRQHFEATDKYRFNKEYLEKIQKNDKLKNNYCLNYNIPLYRISFEQISDIKEILTSLLLDKEN